MNEGKTNNYFWIEIEGNDIGLPDLVTKCPKLFVGRAVAITSFDSGPLVPDDEEKGYGTYNLGYYSNIRIDNISENIRVTMDPEIRLGHMQNQSK